MLLILSYTNVVYSGYSINERLLIKYYAFKGQTKIR